ncbi:juvenile hormone acid O-methyltransferase-like [Bradysia coprophila]|uniref:juvenile hormone acid O-methyltransferase-like n=1 Tax=Bradysia coprophila TaxID=38358 RepID=UPI00187DC38D|nr:juvenile hormone acid O-methyltransferase-like [Bradysia coprophila]
MNKPILYQNSNGLQRSDAQEVLNEFSAGFGCDLSAEMVNYARNKHSQPKMSFEQFDLSIDRELQSTMKGMDFDHITSFYCLMWIHDQQIAARNLYKLLKPGGDMLVVFLAQHPMYDYYKKQSFDDRWSEYMDDADEYISPYQYSNDPAADFRNHLTDAGFRECRVEAREKCYVFNGVEIARNILRSVNPFIDRIPIQNQETYLEDLLQNFVQNHVVRDDFYGNSELCRIAPPYKLMVAYARK